MFKSVLVVAGFLVAIDFLRLQCANHAMELSWASMKPFGWLKQKLATGPAVLRSKLQLSA
jgi:hypothetical protein